MGSPAARLGDPTVHGGVIVAGEPTVIIGNQPAARLTDMHTCPLVTVLVPHVGGPLILGSFTVLTGFLPQSRVGDFLICIGPPDAVAMGCPTVIVGMAGGGMGFGAILAGLMAGLRSLLGRPPEEPVVFDKSKYPEERAGLGALERAFPKLGDDFEVLGPSTRNYNCIAHTLGEDEEWVNPVTGPPGSELRGMDDLYARQGYKRSGSLDYSHVPGKQKIVVYATKNPDGSIKEVTHGAIQDSSGAWTSKLGAAARFRHRTPDALDGPVYGEPVAVYER